VQFSPCVLAPGELLMERVWEPYSTGSRSTTERKPHRSRRGENQSIHPDAHFHGDSVSSKGHCCNPPSIYCTLLSLQSPVFAGTHWAGEAFQTGCSKKEARQRPDTRPSAAWKRLLPWEEASVRFSSTSIRDFQITPPHAHISLGSANHKLNKLQIKNTKKLCLNLNTADFFYYPLIIQYNNYIAFTMYWLPYYK
jgi:hypothetical protein